MSGMEHVLPKEEQFDVVLADSFRRVAAVFRNLSEENDSDNILDPSLELKYISEEPQFIKFCDALGGILKQQGDNTPYVQEVTYRSVMFAYHVIREIEGEEPTHVARFSAQYLQTLKSQGVPLPDAIRAGASEYLSTRPAMNNVITLFAGDLDTTRIHCEYVQTVAGFIFMLSEQHRAEEHLQGYTKDFDPTILLEGEA